VNTLRNANIETCLKHPRNLKGTLSPDYHRFKIVLFRFILGTLKGHCHRIIIVSKLYYLDFDWVSRLIFLIIILFAGIESLDN
jgi:hypothetical protein